MRTTILSLSLLAAPALLAACGDDDNNNNPMCPDPVDAAECPQPPDMAVPPVFQGFDADEGGEIRVEYIKLANGVSTSRITAFAYSDTGTTPYHPYVNLDGCTDVSTDANFNMYWPTATVAPDQRTYYDLGSVVVHNTTSAFVAKPVSAMGPDLFGRMHQPDKWYRQNVNEAPWTPPPPMMTVGSQILLTEKTKYSVTLGGSATFPSHTWHDSVYIPAAFDLAGTPGSTLATTAGIAHNTGADAMTDPDMDGPLTNGVLPAGTDLSVKWTTPADTGPEVEIFGLVGFIAGRPRVICVNENMDATAGEIIVPANLVDIAKAAAAANTNGVGQIARQTLHHVVREIKDNNGPTGKRFDIVGVWCYAGTNYR